MEEATRGRMMSKSHTVGALPQIPSSPPKKHRLSAVVKRTLQKLPMKRDMQNIVAVIARKKYLVERSKKLKARLRERPYDRRALAEYADILYEQQDYISACKVIDRAIICGEDSGFMFITLGKCYYKRWMVHRNQKDINQALESYRIGMRSTDINRYPRYYFEIASIQMRMGKHQAALDMLGSLMTLFLHFPDWTIIAKYNMAHIMLLRDSNQTALELLQQLSLDGVEVKVDCGSDSIAFLPCAMTNMSVNIEIATILDKMNRVSLAKSLFEETYKRIARLRSHMDEDEKKAQFDFRLNTESFSAWYDDHTTFQRIGAMYANMHNLVMAAEMYRIAAKRIQGSKSRWWDMSAAEQQIALGYILERGSCLAELGHYEEAEKCAHFSFEKQPHALAATGRAMRCCRVNHPRNAKIVQTARAMERAILLVQSVIRTRLARKRKLLKEKRIACATKLASFFRMLIVRNRLAHDRLANARTLHINNVIKSLTTGIALLRTGKDAVLMWSEIWFIASTRVQTCCRKWISRIKFRAFFNGVRALERVFRGQCDRLKFRKHIQRVQKQLDENPDLEQRAQLSRNDKRMAINYESVSRVCCGTTVISTNDDILGTIAMDAPASPLRLAKRKERKQQYLNSHSMISMSSSMLTKKEKLSHYGELARQRTASAPGTARTHRSALSTPGSPGGELSITIPYSESVLTEYQSLHPEEDIISFISLHSVINDPTKQWVPFGILPESEIRRIIQCTVLVITSPSFSLTDIKRLCREARNAPEVDQKFCMIYKLFQLWANMRSLFVCGTRIGPSGLRELLRLGIRHLQSITLTSIGVMHHFGTIIGKQLTQNESSMCHLTKLYIEEEVMFGDRGTIELLKYLQLNNTVRILSLRACGIRDRGASACGRFIALSQSLETFNLSENFLSLQNIFLIIRSVANRGSKGKLQAVRLMNQKPKFQLNDLMKALVLGTQLGVKIVSDDIPVTVETAFEIAMRKDTDLEDMEYLRKAFSAAVKDSLYSEDVVLETRFKKNVCI